MEKIIRILALPALLLALTLPVMAQHARLRNMSGIPKEALNEDLSEWGVGDSFEDIFDVVTVRSSSSLKANGINKYGAEQAHDRDLKTAWVEGARGDGIGEYLEYTMTPQRHIGATDRAVMNVVIFNGYRKTRDLWRENGRIHHLRMSVNGKPYGIINLADTYRYQFVDLGHIPLPEHGKLVLRFTIESVYPGTKFHDTALTEMEFGGTGIY